MSDRRSGNGSLAIGGGSIAVMVLTLLLQNSGALGDFSAVLSGPGGVALLAVGCVIASVSFTYRGMVIPARQEVIRVTEDRERVREQLTREHNAKIAEMEKRFDDRQSALETELSEMRQAILKLTEENARHKAMLEGLGMTEAVGAKSKDR